MDEIEEILSKNIKRLRAERGLSQAKLAERAGLSLATVQGYESMRRWPELIFARALAAALNCSTAQLYQRPTQSEAISAQAIFEYVNELEEKLSKLIGVLSFPPVHPLIAELKRDYQTSPKPKK